MKKQLLYIFMLIPVLSVSQSDFELEILSISNAYTMDKIQFTDHNELDSNFITARMQALTNDLIYGGLYVNYDTTDVIVKPLITKDLSKVKVMFSYINDLERDLAVITILYQSFQLEMPNSAVNAITGNYQISVEPFLLDGTINSKEEYQNGFLDFWHEDEDGDRTEIISKLETYLKEAGYLD